jgi:uncharacterized membrane protein
MEANLRFPASLEPVNDELTNNIVTVSKLQIALRAEARTLQAKLTELAVSTDTRTPEGLFALMQQTANMLLDYATFWTHVLANSQTVDSREAAELMFNQLSFQERSKFSAETLTNVNGMLSQQTTPEVSVLSNNTSAYILVTLLLGTADDEPLFREIYSASVLRDVLQDLTLMRESYLMVFELLWTPQSPNETLMEEDLTAEFADLVAIA